MMVAVELAVGRDHSDRPVRRIRPVQETRDDPLAHEPIRVRRRLRLEGDRRRQTGVVEDDSDLAVVAELDAIRPAGVDAAAAIRDGLPRSEDRERDALGRDLPKRRQVDRRLREPDPGGPPPEPQLEVPDAPGDLRPPIGGRGQRQDRVVERLRDRAPAVVDEPPVGGRIRLGHPAGEGRAEIPRDPGESAALGVRSVALGVDPLVPVVERCRGRLRRHLARPRIEAGGLVEVGVDRQPAPTHPTATRPSTARSTATVARCTTVTVARSPGARETRRPISAALPW